MKRHTLALVVAIAMFLTALSVSAYSRPSSSAVVVAKYVVAQPSSSPNFALLKPGKTIVTSVPIAFRVTETVGSVAHTTDFLLGPNPGSTDPAKGWFIHEAGEAPVFYLQQGYVYVVHKKDPPGGTPAEENTRPRVRTSRIGSAGKGTIMIAQVSPELERHFAIESECDLTALLVTGTETLHAGQYSVIASSGAIGSPQTTSNNPEPSQFVSEVYDIAKTFDMDAP